MAKIEINNVYKIFGNTPSEVLPMVKEGATKEEVLEKISLLKQESIDYAQMSLSTRP